MAGVSSSDGQRQRHMGQSSVNVIFAPLRLGLVGVIAALHCSCELMFESNGDISLSPGRQISDCNTRTPQLEIRAVSTVSTKIPKLRRDFDMVYTLSESAQVYYHCIANHTY